MEGNNGKKYSLGVQNMSIYLKRAKKVNWGWGILSVRKAE
jgi:hypothetical protein